MRVGVFGGTFDPTHAGHLAVAHAAHAALALDHFELVPSNLPPHRRAPVAPARDRFAMLVAACAGEPWLVPSVREIERGGVSYTVDTLRELASEFAGADLFLVIGADSYDELPTWRAAGEIQALAHLAVLPRPGSVGSARPRAHDAARIVAPGDAVPAGNKGVFAVPMTPVAIAARDVRAQLARGVDPGDALPRPVFQYIRLHGLYGWPGPGVAQARESE